MMTTESATSLAQQLSASQQLRQQLSDIQQLNYPPSIRTSLALYHPLRQFFGHHFLVRYETPVMFGRGRMAGKWTTMRVTVDGPMVYADEERVFISGHAELHRIPYQWVTYMAPIETAVMEGYV